MSKIHLLHIVAGSLRSSTKYPLMTYVQDTSLVFAFNTSHLVSFFPNSPIVQLQVGDFGLSRIKRNTLVSGGVRGTLPWMAPELLNGSSNRVSEKVGWDKLSYLIITALMELGKTFY